MEYHVPVLLKESVDGLAIKPGGIYVDVTFGGGGHSREILKRLQDGRLFAFDQDPDALANSSTIDNRSFTLIDANFRYLKKYMKLHGVAGVDGILADLGISSHQINTPERGFSTRFDAPLDMRMDKSSSLSAREVLNEYTEEKLHKIFGMYGEVTNAKSLAHAVVKNRHANPLNTIEDFKEAIKLMMPRGKEFKYLAQVFQAIRIEVNDELKALEEMLVQSAEVLNPGGRLVVIAYHSLEDRLVKNFIGKGKFFGEIEKDIYGNFEKPFDAFNKKPIEASEEEIKINNRARSAKLRIAVKI